MERDEKMKRKCLILTVVLCICSNAKVFAASYSGGNGTAANPYIISTVANWTTLRNTSTDWGKYFILTANLNFGGSSITPVGTGWSTPFSGVFDGQGFIMRNAVINQPSSDNAGIFGLVSEGGQICNLGVEQMHITGKNCVGGLVGQHWGGTITACYSTGSVSGIEGVGGLVGDNAYGRISNCFSTCSVNGNSRVGGLVGGHDAMSGRIEFCYTIGTVSGTGDDVGGLDGQNYENATFSFWDIQTSGQTISYSATGLSTAAMKNPYTFLRAFWDFKGEITNGTNDFWIMQAGGGYPILAWQVDTSSAPANDEMDNAAAITVGSPLMAFSANTTGVDLTVNGYNDWADVWYYFDCASSDKYTVSVTDLNFDTTVGVFDEMQREIVFNDDSFEGKSTVILKATFGKRYYIRVSGADGSTGSFTILVQQGAIRAIQGDLNYDGAVNLIDFSIMAENWLL